MSDHLPALPPDPGPPSGSTLPLPTTATRGAALAAALAALDALADRGETIADEWTYVTALADAGRASLRAAAGDDLGAMLAPELAAAIDAACAETTRITDPHRAIDWLSTFPAVVELVLGGAPGTSVPGPTPAGD